MASENNESTYVSTPEQDWEKTSAYAATRDLLITFTIGKTGLIPKPAQLRFAMALILQHDVSCVAATGFGKSLAFQMAMFLLGGKFGIVVTPLNRLGQDQVEKCKKIGIRAVLLNAETQQKQANIISKIYQGEFDLGMYIAITHEHYINNWVYSLCRT